MYGLRPLVVLQVLASYINPVSQLVEHFEAAVYEEDEQSTRAGLPPSLPELLSQSCLVPAISSYLRNDSGELVSLQNSPFYNVTCCLATRFKEYKLGIEHMQYSVVCCVVLLCLSV